MEVCCSKKSDDFQHTIPCYIANTLSWKRHTDQLLPKLNMMMIPEDRTPQSQLWELHILRKTRSSWGLRSGRMERSINFHACNKNEHFNALLCKTLFMCQKHVTISHSWHSKNYATNLHCVNSPQWYSGWMNIIVQILWKKLFDENQCYAICKGGKY
jgi:hypothetical protein